MKIAISSPWLVLFFGLALLGAGCDKAQQPYAAVAPSAQPQPAAPTTPGTPSWATSTPINDAPKRLELFKKWAIPSDAPAYAEANHPDCLGLENGRTYGGDIISTLVVDEKRSKEWEVEVYTPEYAQNMDRLMAYFTKKKYGKNFFAFYVCHLGENLDVASGYVSENGVDEEKVRDTRAIKQIALLRNGEVVHELESVDVLDNLAIGAPVYPCDARIHVSNSGRQLVWSCFKGLHKVSEGLVSGSDMKEWTFTLDGQLVGVEERVGI